MFLKAAPPALGDGCVAGTGQWHCVSSRLACGQMFLKAAPRPLGGVASTGHGHCVSSRLACGQMLLKAAPPALGGGCVAIAGQWHCVSSRLAFGQMFLKAAPRPLGRVRCGCGPRALRFVTVGLWPNVPHSSAPALGGRCECGPRALRFVTVGLWPNVPQSSAPGPRHEDRQASFPQRILPMLKIHERSECPCWHCPHGPKRRAR